MDLLPNKPARHILTVAVEDYFQATAFSGLIDSRQWARFETRVEQNTLHALDLLDRHSTTATFFFMTWVAERFPQLVREVVRRGHEVADGGDSKRSFRQLSPGEFASQLRRSKAILENAAGMRVRGFRAADHRLSRRDLWALRTLADNGYQYDSSLNPSLFSFHREPWRQFIHSEEFDGNRIWEVPLSSLKLCGFQLPVAGGNWFRQMPEMLIRRAVAHWSKRYNEPFVMYFRIWDLDLDQPVITGASRISKLRHYRNSGKMPALLDAFLSAYHFTSISDHLDLAPERVEPASAPAAVIRPAYASKELRIPVTIVIPCYNETSALPYLANALRGLREHATQYDIRLVFVNDGSSDDTGEKLRALFADWAGAEIVNHDRNRGVAAAVLTGIRAARTETVCSMDCDCTYDPEELPNMIPLLTPDVDLVTASPYHPDGRVLRVPAWRLALSKGASALYRAVLRQPLHTYTSCFRVYRRSAVLAVELKQPGFLGVAELLGKLDLSGSRIVEYPATLNVRMLGHSKMKIVRTIAGHFRLMLSFALERLRHRPEPLRARSCFNSTVLLPKGFDRD